MFDDPYYSDEICDCDNEASFALFVDHDEIRPRYASIIEKFVKDYGLQLMGQGRHRRSYLSASGKYVYKFPINVHGENANKEETTIYAADSEGNKARCRLIWVQSLPVVIMEVVTPWWLDKRGQGQNGDRLPDWIWAYDGGQVGFNRKGKLVAWDYTLS